MSDVTEEGRGTWPATPTLAAGEPLSEGDPLHFAPELLSRLTRMERKHVGRAREWYVRKHSAGAYWTLPRGETPRSMARRIVRHGVWGASWVKTTPVMILLGYPIGWLFTGGSAAATSAGVALALCEPLLWFRMVRRRRQVDRWFDDLYPETPRAGRAMH